MKFQMKGAFVRGKIDERVDIEVLSKVKEDTCADIIFYRRIRGDACYFRSVDDSRCTMFESDLSVLRLLLFALYVQRVRRQDLKTRSGREKAVLRNE